MEVGLFIDIFSKMYSQRTNVLIILHQLDQNHIYIYIYILLITSNSYQNPIHDRRNPHIRTGDIRYVRTLIDNEAQYIYHHDFK